jgi:hypothetical protein
MLKLAPWHRRDIVALFRRQISGLVEISGTAIYSSALSLKHSFKWSTVHTKCNTWSQSYDFRIYNYNANAVVH